MESRETGAASHTNERRRVWHRLLVSDTVERLWAIPITYRVVNAMYSDFPPPLQRSKVAAAKQWRPLCFSMAPKLGLLKNKNLTSGCFSRGHRRSDTPTGPAVDRLGVKRPRARSPVSVSPTQRQGDAQNRNLCKRITEVSSEQLRAKWVICAGRARPKAFPARQVPPFLDEHCPTSEIVSAVP